MWGAHQLERRAAPMRGSLSPDVPPVGATSYSSTAGADWKRVRGSGRRRCSNLRFARCASAAASACGCTCVTSTLIPARRRNFSLQQRAAGILFHACRSSIVLPRKTPSVTTASPWCGISDRRTNPHNLDSHSREPVHWRAGLGVDYELRSTREMSRIP